MVMQYIDGHLKKNLNKWTGKKWYHQRFDGSPYFLHFIAESGISAHSDRKMGAVFTANFCFYEEGKADWYFIMDDFTKVYNAVAEAQKKINDISDYFIKLWKPDKELFYKKCLEVGKAELSELSNDELIALHDDFSHAIINANSSTSIIDGFALGTDEMIAEKIKEAYDASKIKDVMRETEVFSILTAPVHLFFLNQAEIDLLKIAMKLETMKRVFITYDVESIIARLKSEKKFYLLEDHQKNYFWIRNNYVSDNILGVDYFIEELRKIFKSGINIKNEIKRISEAGEANRKKKIELQKKLKIPPDLKSLIKISEDFTYWQDERKKSTFWATHYSSLILSEISKRIDIDIELLKYMSCREISNVFIKKPGIKLLQARKKNCVYYWDANGMECVHSKQADDVKKAVIGSLDTSKVDDFRGLSACLGKASGVVKVVKSATEIGKVNQGDVLVAVMTRPDYVPAMKKAAAIVTDEGGVTCHAAIISRELNIPCVIGTKIATKVLKDGDFVEVNANHAWVRMMKRKK